MAEDASTQTSPMSAWLIGLFFGAIDSIMLFEITFVGAALALAFLGLAAWKGPRLPAAAGLITGVGLVWTVLFANTWIRCATESAASGSGCDTGAVGVWVAAAAGLLLVGVLGTVVAARRLRAR